MDKANLLKCIAVAAYNIGFGAKKHFATAEIAGKGPGWVGVVSAFCGIFGLLYDPLSGKIASAALVFAGFCAFYMATYKAEDYERAGEDLTDVYNKLHNLYRSVQSGNSVRTGEVELATLQAKAHGSAITKQIFGSGWFAHFKFFCEQQIDWVDEQLNFKFWKDKVPASAKALLYLAVTIAVIGGVTLGIRAAM